VVSPVRGSLWITAVSHEGKIEWQREAGPFAAEWGYGSSPVLYQSLVIACADHRGSGVDRIVGSSWIAALDRETGEIIWRVKRNEGDSFGTPIVVRIGGTDQLVLAGKDAVISYEPATGEILWKCRWDCKRVANTVAFDDRHVFVSTRQPRPETLCIDASGRGDVTGTHIVWRENKSACDVPSPCVFEGRVFLMADEGILICLNATNGHVDWKRRLGGKVSASPTIIGRRIYCCGEEGTVSVVSPDGQVEYETNLGEAIMSSAIATPVRLYVRAANNLYCFQK
jgi:outer membrane protein assembly factor BamB